MTFSPTTVIVLVFNGISAVVAAALFMLVLLQAPRQRTNQLFALAMALQLAYSLTNMLGRFIDPLELDAREATLSAVTIYGWYITACLFFVTEFSAVRTWTTRLARVSAVGLGLSNTAMFWSDLLLVDIRPAGTGDGSYVATWTPAGYVVAGTLLVYVVLMLVILRQASVERARTLWPGPVFILLGAFSSLVIWPLTRIPLQAVFLALAALALGWPVLRLQLFSPLTQLNAELAQRNAALREAYRMKNQFLANVSYELRTPLNAIIGYTELVLNGTYGALNDTQRDRLEKIVRNGKSLLGLINDVLDLNRLDTGRVTLERRPLETAALLDQVLEVIEPLATAKGLTVLRDYATAPPVYGDDMRVRQILTNIVGNAVKFTPQGSVLVRAWGEGDGVRFAITDTGIGIAPDDFERIFNEFEQLDSSSTRQYEGTGLGLAITRRLVELHGGQVGLESTPGQGTTFYVTLPCSLHVPESAQPQPV